MKRAQDVIRPWHYLAAFGVLQGLPFLLLLAHPIYAMLSSFLVFPLSVVAVVLLFRRPKWGRMEFVTTVLFLVSILWHGAMIHACLTAGVID